LCCCSRFDDKRKFAAAPASKEVLHADGERLEVRNVVLHGGPVLRCCKVRQVVANLVLRPEGRGSVGALRVTRLKDKGKSMKV
jgi:hypothetical protein